MKLKTINQKKLILLSITVVITVAFVILLVMVRNEYKYNASIFEDQTIEKYNEQYETILHGYRQLSRAYFAKINSNDEILEIMWKANFADEEERNYLRNELYKLSLADYERSVNDDFRQYHFVLHDNTSFLRMHKPERFGDDLKDVRDSVRIANEEERYVEGFEEGRIFNGYRFEYPLYYNEEIIGCVEISLSYASITRLMENLFETQSVFILKSSIVNEKVFDDLIEAGYIPAPFAPDYYIDSETIEYIQDNTDSCFFNELNEELVIQEKTSQLGDGSTFFVDIKHENTEYGIVFLNIDNIAEEHAGYLVFINNYNFYNYAKTYKLHTIMLAIMWAMMVAIVLLFVINRGRIEKITYFDKLTGVYNRNKLYGVAETEMQRDFRYKNNLSLILFDIDKFKSVNDVYGHMMGDKVLRKIAAKVLSNIRGTDTLFRYGGDEFLILLPSTNLMQAKQVAQKINRLIEKEIWEGYNEPITVSIGVAQYNREETFEQLIHRTDIMLYKAKNSGRNGVFANDEQ
ncbi:MAG: diguanylate cyclase [Clostridiales bacterium]|nr:diguanylate cyclase [Clostridiales bacterium]